MSDHRSGGTPPGWYPDNTGQTRWWDGEGWTPHTQPAAPQGGPGQQPFRSGPQPGQQYSGHPTAGPGQGGHGSQGRKGGAGKVIAAVLALVVALAAIAAVWFFFLRGGGGPEEVADDYLNAAADSDFETLCDLTAADDQEALLEAADGAGDCAEASGWAEDQEEELRQQAEDSGVEVPEDPDLSFEVGDVTEDGDDATVEYSVTVDGETSDEELELVREDGDWKVVGGFAGGLTADVPEVEGIEPPDLGDDSGDSGSSSGSGGSSGDESLSPDDLGIDPDELESLDPDDLGSINPDDLGSLDPEDFGLTPEDLEEFESLNLTPEDLASLGFTPEEIEMLEQLGVI